MKDVQKIYEDVNVFFKDNLKHSLAEVEDFHKKLLSKRKEILSTDLLSLQTELLEISKQIEEQNKQLNENLDFLQAHSAMGKYVIAIRQIDSLKVDLGRDTDMEKSN